MALYEYRVAMYICGEYVAFFQLEENKEGSLVPMKCLSVRNKESSYWWNVNTAFAVVNWHRKNQETIPVYQEINVYQEILKEKPAFRESFWNEASFWKNVKCIHFYQKENGEYTITALKKSKWRRNKFSGYIKRIHIPNNYYDSERKAVVFELIDAIDNYHKSLRKEPIGVEEFRKDESIGKHKFPWKISLYKGEKRILIIPYLDHVAGYSQQPDQMVVLEEDADASEIGKGIMEVIHIFETSPRLAGNTEGYRLATKYKGWKSFSKRNKLVSINVNEDFSYKIIAEECPKGDGIYQAVMEARKIDANVTVEELGKSIIDCFLHFSKGTQAYDPYPTKELELLDGSKLTVKHPADKHFEDYEDYNVGEIYQCYCYIPKEDAESSAEFFLGIAPEIDCDLEPENVRNSWEKVYGKAEFFEMKEEPCGIFTCCAEMKNKSTHKISYFLKMDENLILECTMDVHQPGRRKKLDEKLVSLFGEFVLNCRR